MTKMTREQMLDYLKGFDNKDYNKDKKDEVKVAVDKMSNLLKKFGFEYEGSFNSLYLPLTVQNQKREVTSWFYRLQLGEYESIRVQIGWTYKTKAYGRGRNKKEYVVAIKGTCRVSHERVSLNPRTGKPWKVGDIDYSRPDQPMLTRRGWWTGD